MDPSFYVEDGCFVYQVIGEPIEVRFKPSDCDGSRTGQLYRPGDMVAVDRILCSPEMHEDCGGPFLRLADGTGWLFERKNTEQTMQRIAVKCGLFCFFVGNYPEGQTLLRHPTDRADLCVIGRNKKLLMYDTLQKIYCDRKVQDPQTGINYYRVQGTTGWVVEKRSGRSRKDDCQMLIDENHILKGLFAFRAITEVGIRGLPRLGQESQTGLLIQRGQICVVDAIYTPLSLSTDNGPFLHLEDGTGWLLKTEASVKLLEPLHITKGLWTASVLNPPEGITSYRHPFAHSIKELPGQEARQDASFTADYWVTLADNEVRIALQQRSAGHRVSNIHKCIAQYEPGTTLICDRKITHEKHSCFRVKGTKGWIIDRIDSGEKVIKVDIKPIKPATAATARSSTVSTGWTVEFVRGAAAVVKGLQEIAFNQQQEVITFKTGKDVRLHVYYTSRTVGVIKDDPELGKTQVFCQDCSNEDLGQIFCNPLLETASNRRYSRRLKGDQLILHSAHSECSDSAVDEEGYRNELLDVESEINRIKEKEHELLRKIDEYDERRCMLAEDCRRERRQRIAELEMVSKDINLLVREKVKEIAQRQEAELRHLRARSVREEQQRRKKLELTCLECFQCFRNPRSRDEHCRTAHGLYCDHCGRTFRSAQDLDDHCISQGHY